MALLAADTPVLGGGDRLDLTLMAGGGGLEVVLRLALEAATEALERAREALSISLADMDAVGLGEVGVVALELDLGEVGLMLELGLEGAGRTVVLDFGEVGLALGLGETGGEVALVDVDKTASLTELTT